MHPTWLYLLLPLCICWSREQSDWICKPHCLPLSDSIIVNHSNKGRFLSFAMFEATVVVCNNMSFRVVAMVELYPRLTWAQVQRKGIANIGEYIDK